MNSEGEIQKYHLRTDEFYNEVTPRGQLTIVAAMSGGHKSNFALNCAAAAIIRNERVLYIDLDLPMADILRRLYCMLCRFPADDSHSPEGYDRLKAAGDEIPSIASVFKLVDLSIYKTSPEQVLVSIAEYIATYNPDVVIVDGTERVAAEYRRTNIDVLVSGLAALASKYNISVVATSQVTKTADEAEIVRGNELSEAQEKVHRSGLVVNIGPRIRDELLTVCIVKDRNRARPDGNVLRLTVQSCLRLEILPYGGFDPSSLPIPVPVESQRFDALPGDFPDDLDGEHEDTARDTVQITGSLRPIIQLCPDSFVQITRTLQLSQMFTNRDTNGVFWLLDLIFNAQIDDNYSPNAPGTRIPIPLKRNQLMMSHSMLSKRWDVSEKVVDRFLKAAAGQGLITVEKVLADLSRRNIFEPSSAPTQGPKQKALCTVITINIIRDKPADDLSPKKAKRNKTGSKESTKEGPTRDQEGTDEGPLHE